MPCFLVLIALFAPRFGNGLLRVMAPLADIPPYTATQVIDSSVRPGDARVPEGSDVEIGFNPTFLTDALRVVDSDEISLEMTAPNRPGLLKGGLNFLYVIMPVNLQ